MLVGWVGPAMGQRFEVSLDEALELSRRADFTATLVESNAPANIFHPGERPKLVAQLVNASNKSIQADGVVEVIAFGMQRSGNIWRPTARILGRVDRQPLKINLKAGDWTNIELTPAMPGQLGGCAVVIDLGDHGRQLLTTFVASAPVEPKRVQHPTQSFQPIDGPVAKRLGLRSIRYNTGFRLPGTPQRAEYEQHLDELFSEMHENNVTVLVQMATAGEGWPMDVRREHLDENDMMKGGKADLVWLPEYDDEFEDFVYWIASKYGWPKGPVTAFNLWNEPWEGSSISGWQADIPRYRKIYRHMADAVLRARKDANVDVLVGGCDSAPNALDKLFPDGTETMLPLFDFVSIHYMGLRTPALYKFWHNREIGSGRVLVWDTESWVANSDDVFCTVVATNRAAGYDRAMGVKESYVIEHGDFRRRRARTIQTKAGPAKAEPLPQAMPMAAAVAAVQHFIGERPFGELLFTRGLPWVYVFEGEDGQADDGTVVIAGDMQTLFNGTHSAFHTIRDLGRVDELHAMLDGDHDRAALEQAFNERPPLEGATLTLDDHDGRFRLFDFYGNRVAADDGKLVVPLDVRGFFLRTDGSVGSFAALKAALRESRIDGLQPIEIVARDLLTPVGQSPTLRVDLANVLNRPVRGRIDIALEGATLDGPDEVALEAHETRRLTYRITGGTLASDNRYPLRVVVDAGEDGTAVHYEPVRVNMIHRRTIKVDGKLDDWRGALPQIIETAEAAKRSFTEEMWLPFEKLEAGEAGGFAAGYLAYDDEHFYFAAKVADDSPHPGTLRFETRDDSQFFYPETSYSTNKRGEKVAHHWPDGVRRFSYRRRPIIPSGGGFDNIQIAFNAIPMDEDPIWLSHLPGRMPGFIWYRCTDYEYALNKVAEEYGGGHEVWRLSQPDMYRKHYFPRQPKHPDEGPVEEARLMVRYEGGARITEVAIPWSELPHVKQRLDAGETVKFSFRVNQDKRGPTMELAMNRSVSELNRMAFQVSWNNHWANELEFAFEK